MNESEMPVVMFTNYKRPDGFEISLTLRGTKIEDVAGDLNMAIEAIIKKGGTPVS
jgi:predicted SpoU family rRNA methylase